MEQLQGISGSSPIQEMKQKWGGKEEETKKLEKDTPFASILQNGLN